MNGFQYPENPTQRQTHDSRIRTHGPVPQDPLSPPYTSRTQDPQAMPHTPGPLHLAPGLSPDPPRQPLAGFPAGMGSAYGSRSRSPWDSRARGGGGTGLRLHGAGSTGGRGVGDGDQSSDTEEITGNQGADPVPADSRGGGQGLYHGDERRRGPTLSCTFMEHARAQNTREHVK